MMSLVPRLPTTSGTAALFRFWNNYPQFSGRCDWDHQFSFILPVSCETVGERHREYLLPRLILLLARTPRRIIERRQNSTLQRFALFSLVMPNMELKLRQRSRNRS